MDQNLDQEIYNAASENGQEKAVFKLLEVKNTPKKKGKGDNDPQSAEKVDKKDKDSAK